MVPEDPVLLADTEKTTGSDLRDPVTSCCSNLQLGFLEKLLVRGGLKM